MWPAFLGAGQAGPLLAALQGLKRDYGINLIDPTHAAVYRCWRRRAAARPARLAAALRAEAGR